MVKYTLIYFNGRGRAEASRLLFALADVEYEDERIVGENWSKMKPDMPFGQLPALKVDDVTLCQSEAIEFYLAKTFELAGSTALEEAQTLMIGSCATDTLAPFLKMHGLKDEEAKNEIRKKYETEQLPKFLGMLEKLLVSNKGGDGYFVGDKISLADLRVITTFELFPMFGVTFNINDYPKLKSLDDRVRSEPRIAAWIAKRPESRF